MISTNRGTLSYPHPRQIPSREMNRNMNFCYRPGLSVCAPYMDQEMKLGVMGQILGVHLENYHHGGQAILSGSWMGICPTIFHLFQRIISVELKQKTCILSINAPGYISVQSLQFQPCPIPDNAHILLFFSRDKLVPEFQFSAVSRDGCASRHSRQFIKPLSPR